MQTVLMQGQVIAIFAMMNLLSNPNAVQGCMASIPHATGEIHQRAQHEHQHRVFNDCCAAWPKGLQIQPGFGALHGIFIEQDDSMLFVAAAGILTLHMSPVLQKTNMIQQMPHAYDHVVVQ